MISRALLLTSKALLALASILAFALCFVVVADVVGRTAFNVPLRGTPEMVSSSIVVICYLQAAYAIISGGMLEVDVITANLPARLRAAMSVFSCLLGVFLFAVIGWGSLDGFVHAFTSGEFEGEGALHVPVWPVRLAVLVGSTLAALAYLLLAARQIEAARQGRAIAIGATH
jgi:TRAP-type C4-dicarboxylate transport system permease small subunit